MTTLDIILKTLGMVLVALVAYRAAYYLFCHLAAAVMWHNSHFESFVVFEVFALEEQDTPDFVESTTGKIYLSMVRDLDCHLEEGKRYHARVSDPPVGVLGEGQQPVYRLLSWIPWEEYIDALSKAESNNV